MIGKGSGRFRDGDGGRQKLEKSFTLLNELWHPVTLLFLSA